MGLPDDNPWLDALAPTLAALGAFAALQAVWPRPSAWSRPLALSVSIAMMAQYALWRYEATLPPRGLTADYIVGVGFFGVEICGFLASALSFFFLSRTRNRSADADAGADWFERSAPCPLIDVLICSYNEEEAILERTIVGALAMDYPRFRVWMLDDSRRPWLKALCARLGCLYLTRPDNRHAKAGNINHALGLLQRLTEPPDFVSILDADFVPTPRFLRRAMTLMRDPKVGLVQTPQHFVNPDPIQINLRAARFWPDEQRFFFDVVMPSKDAWGAAFCCGTSSIIRAAPLFANQGFPTDSVTEDYLLTLRLRERGFETVYLNEPLTYGLAPEGLKEYVTQRARWCLGFMQIARGRSGPLSNDPSLDWVRRMALMETFLNWTAVYAVRAVAIVIPALSLGLDLHPYQASVFDVLKHFLPFFLWNGFVMHWITLGRVVPMISDVGYLVVTPAILKAAFVGLLRPQGQKFRVTAKGGDRRRGFVEWALMQPFLLLIALSLLALARAAHLKGGAELLQFYVPALFWCWYNIVMLVILCFVCVEQPRFRASERYPSRETITIRTATGGKRAQLRDISITGAMIAGPAPVSPGERLSIGFEGFDVGAKVVRGGADSHSVEFEHTHESRIKMIRHFYAGGYVQPLGHIEAVKVGAAIARRILD